MIPEEIEELRNKAFNEARTFRRNLIKQNNRLDHREALADLVREEINKRFPNIMGLLYEWQYSAGCVQAHNLKKIELEINGGNFEDISEEIDIDNKYNINLTDDIIKEYIQIVEWNKEYYDYKYYKEREGKILYRGSKNVEIKNKPLQSFTSKKSIVKKFGYHKRECKVTMDNIRFIPELLPNWNYYNEREFIISKEEA